MQLFRDTLTIQLFAKDVHWVRILRRTNRIAPTEIKRSYLRKINIKCDYILFSKMIHQLKLVTFHFQESYNFSLLILYDIMSNLSTILHWDFMNSTWYNMIITYLYKLINTNLNNGVQNTQSYWTCNYWCKFFSPLHPTTTYLFTN